MESTYFFVFHKNRTSPTSQTIWSSASRQSVQCAKRTDLPTVAEGARKLLQQFTKRCRSCQVYAQASRGFKFTLWDKKAFSSALSVDIFYINAKPVSHVVDESTTHQAARWLPSVSAKSVWRAVRLCRIDVYPGPPDVGTHDAGKHFMAKLFNPTPVWWQLKPSLFWSRHPTWCHS